MKQEIILNTAADIATYRTDIKGWVGKNGRYYGEDERLARYANSTHIICECGQVTSKSYTICETCRAAKNEAKWLAAERRPLSYPLFSDTCESYFFDEEELFEHCHDSDTKPEEMRLYLCREERPPYIEASDFLHDYLPEDGEVPAELQKAFDQLNEALRAYPQPLSYSSSKFVPNEIPIYKSEAK